MKEKGGTDRLPSATANSLKNRSGTSNFNPAVAEAACLALLTSDSTPRRAHHHWLKVGVYLWRCIQLAWGFGTYHHPPLQKPLPQAIGMPAFAPTPSPGAMHSSFFFLCQALFSSWSSHNSSNCGTDLAAPSNHLLPIGPGQHPGA